MYEVVDANDQRQAISLVKRIIIFPMTFTVVVLLDD